MRLILVLLVTANLMGCAYNNPISPPMKKSGVEFGANYKEIQAKILAGQEYADLSPEASREYLAYQADYETLRLILTSPRISDSTIREFLLSKRSPKAIKEAIATSAQISPESKQELQEQISQTQARFANRKLGAAKVPPKGAIVSAHVSGSVATVTIGGIIPTKVELYKWGSLVDLGPVNRFDVDLNEGRRFNFTFLDTNTEHFVLLTPDMQRNASYVSFLGNNVGIDCGNPAGCSFVITAR